MKGFAYIAPVDVGVSTPPARSHGVQMAAFGASLSLPCVPARVG